MVLWVSRPSPNLCIEPLFPQFLPCSLTSSTSLPLSPQLPWRPFSPASCPLSRRPSLCGPYIISDS
ncbi:hypothetical protein M406DRAFT_57458, partial [Cryphonectria parasitica EP155]